MSPICRSPREMMFNACASRSRADIAEVASTDDRRSKRADIKRGRIAGASYKVSAFAKIKGERALYFTIYPGFYHFAKYALLPYRLYFPDCYASTSPSSISIDDDREVVFFVRIARSGLPHSLPPPPASSAPSSTSMNSKRGRNFVDPRDAYRSSRG